MTTLDTVKRLVLPQTLAVFMLLGLHTGTATADCLDPGDAATDAVRGQIGAFPGTSPIAWRAMQESAGLDHSQVSVDVAWIDPAGRRQHQALMMGEVAGRMPTVTHEGPLLVVRLRYCDFQGPCRSENIPYAWDRQARRFVGTTTVGQRAMANAESCESGQE
ncbi:hypothetical protein [Paraburkholderia sp.]|uniref:hypothetical protein n=1 Tax=Paraburkholderia sp. TaxID=1926495 RepID=UPI003D6FA73E